MGSSCSTRECPDLNRPTCAVKATLVPAVKPQEQRKGRRRERLNALLRGAVRVRAK